MRTSKEEIQQMFLDGLTTIEIEQTTGMASRTIRRYVSEVRELRAKMVVKKNEKLIISSIPQNITANIQNGTVVVFSDAHVVPGELSVAAEGLLILVEQLKPKIVVNGGDLMDFAGISRHDKLGWDNDYTVADELEAGMEFLKQVYLKSLKAEHIYIEGNHDTRFNKFLAKHTPQYKGVKGMDIRDHIPKEWKYTISMLVNNNTMFLHGWHSGIHGAYNNTLKSGMNIVTGHSHKLIVHPYTDFTGTRYAIETGTLSTIVDNKIFNYTNASPLNWIAGFAVLTYVDGKLQYPEVACVNSNNQLIFRGEIIK